MGYHRAGFEVVGVDINPQPHYPFEFHQGDAMTWPLDGFDAIHASPPCQAWSRATAWGRDDRHKHEKLIAPVRELLTNQAAVWVIENVPDARREMFHPVLLCGTFFGLPVIRHRYFESSVLLQPMWASCDHRGVLVFEHKQERAYGDAMGCDWMNRDGHRQAIPPAYTEWIGAQLMAVIQGPA